MPISLLGMLLLTTSQQRFTCVGHILQPQLPTAARLAVATSPHGSVARLSGGGYSVPSASHPGVTPSARPGRVPVAEHRIFIFPDKYACDFVSHWRAKRRQVVRGRGRARTNCRSGAGDVVSRSQRRESVRASDTPWSHLWAPWGSAGVLSSPRCDRRAAAA
jgi:hypothetical protein